MAVLAGYVRVSSLCQKDNTSFQTQCDHIEAYAKLHGHTISYVAFDIDSGGTINRGGLSFALNSVKTGQVDGLICAKLDRLARSVQDGLTMATDFRKWAKQLVIMDLHLDTSDYMGEFIYTVFLAIAQLERKTIQKRTQEGKDKVDEIGGWREGQPGYGYRMVKDVALRCSVRVPIPDEQEWIQKMVDWRNQGWGYRRITRELTRLAVPSKHGAEWKHQTVKGIIERHAQQQVPYE